MSKSFSDLGINQLLQNGLADLEITIPTDIQIKIIPILLNQTEDVIAIAKTGAGKTVAFALPLLQLIDLKDTNIQVLILAPTRELGHQIHENLTTYALHIPEISIVSVCGGIPLKSQIKSLNSTTHIVVATPGRFIDLINRGHVNAKYIKYLVFDEADEMVSTFKDDLDIIIKEFPKNYRTLLFTATLSGAIKQLVQNHMSKNIIQIETDMSTVGHQGIDHHYMVVKPIEKLNVLMHFLSTKKGERGIIFCKTKAAVNKLGKNLSINKFSLGSIHGSLTQGIRDRIMSQFRQGYIDILVATDLAARGIDVKEISYVVNYHLPDAYETYVHRSGRSARAGAKGFSIVIVQEEEVKEIADFEKELGVKFIEFKKGNAKNIEENNGLLWAKKIFKTKLNINISEKFRQQVSNVFNHLTKEELIDKMLTNYLTNTSKTISKKSDLTRSKKK